GRSEMAAIIPLTDPVARTITNPQLAGETLAVPPRYAPGMSKSHFGHTAGTPIPAGAAYFRRSFATQKVDPKVGPLSAADLKNFHETIGLYGRLASTLTGFPARYFGLHTANPAAEGAIRADENQMVKAIERQNSEVGVGLAWVMGLYERFRTGSW